MKNTIKDFYETKELQGEVVNLNEVYTYAAKHALHVFRTKEVGSLSVHIYIENDNITLYPELKASIEREASTIVDTPSETTKFIPLNVLISTLNSFSTSCQQEILVDIRRNSVSSYRLSLTPQASPAEFTIVDVPNSDFKFLVRTDNAGNKITAGTFRVDYDINTDTTNYYIREIKRKEEDFINRFSKAILAKREELKSNVPMPRTSYHSSKSILNFSLMRGAGADSTFMCNSDISKEYSYQLFELNDFSNIYNFADPVSIKKVQKKFNFTLEIPKKQKSSLEEIYKLLKEIFTGSSNNLIIIDNSHLLYLLIPVLINVGKDVTKDSALLVDESVVSCDESCMKVLQEYLNVKLF